VKPTCHNHLLCSYWARVHACGSRGARAAGVGNENGRRLRHALETERHGPPHEARRRAGRRVGAGLAGVSIRTLALRSDVRALAITNIYNPCRAVALHAGLYHTRTCCSLPLPCLRGRLKSTYFGSFSQGTHFFARREKAQSHWQRGQRSTLVTKRRA
jgi:hypothetical protein